MVVSTCATDGVALAGAALIVTAVLGGVPRASLEALEQSNPPCVPLGQHTGVYTRGCQNEKARQDCANTISCQ
jgi:hypothetical protein